jgi:hypothetical protein
MGVCRTVRVRDERLVQRRFSTRFVRIAPSYGHYSVRYVGDLALIPLAERAGLPEAANEWRHRGGALDWWSRLAGVAGLAGLVLASLRREELA